MHINGHECELLRMELPPANYDEFLYEPHVPEPVLEPTFLVESASSGQLQPEPSQAEPSRSSPAFTELPARLSFTALMGLKFSRVSSDSAVRKLSEPVKADVDMTGVGQLIKEQTERDAML